MVAEQLLKGGINVEQIVVKRLMNFERVRLEVRYGKLRFVRKVVKKLFFRGRKTRLKRPPVRKTLANN